MADILSFNLTQTETTTGTFKPRKMNDPDLSTKLKLMGVDVSVILIPEKGSLTFGECYECQVASFGDFFAHERMKERLKMTPIATNGNSVITVAQARNGRKHRSPEERPDEPIKCLTYKDPFASVYKKWASSFRVLDSVSYLPSRYIFSADGKYLLGGIMIGDVRDYVKLVAIVKKKVHGSLRVFWCRILMFVVYDSRKHSKFHLLNLSLLLQMTRTMTVPILTTIPKFAHVTFVILILVISIPQLMTSHRMLARDLS
jgi:hypothetical protein